MKGKLDGTSLRVPVPDRLGHRLQRRPVDARRRVDEINAAYAKAAQERPAEGRARATPRTPIVSSDIVGDPHSCIFDAELTMSMGKLVKVLGWYDNEWGYSNRLVDIVAYTGSKRRQERRAHASLMDMAIPTLEDLERSSTASPAGASSCAPTSTCRSTAATITDDFRIRAALPTHRAG